AGAKSLAGKAGEMLSSLGRRRKIPFEDTGTFGPRPSSDKKLVLGQLLKENVAERAAKAVAEKAAKFAAELEAFAKETTPTFDPLRVPNGRPSLWERLKGAKERIPKLSDFWKKRAKATDPLYETDFYAGVKPHILETASAVVSFLNSLQEAARKAGLHFPREKLLKSGELKDAIADANHALSPEERVAEVINKTFFDGAEVLQVKVGSGILPNGQPVTQSGVVPNDNMSWSDVYDAILNRIR
ncbi:MAG: hypothetical protein Q7S68_00785, partial [Deltaproteobacteria bacterium]|nr:hypothetical protein [Deltaproteobacteria bacterium]